MPPKRKPQEPKEERGGEKRPNIEEEAVKPEPKPREHAKEEEKEEDNAERGAPLHEEKEEVNPREKKQDVNPREKKAERGNGRQPNERAEKRGGRVPQNRQRRALASSESSEEEDEEEDEEQDSDHYGFDDGDDSEEEREEEPNFNTWTSQRVVQYWIQHPPFTSEAFPMPPKQDTTFSAPHYGTGIWKWRLPGTQNWHQHDTETTAIYEYNYRRGVRAFKVERAQTVLWPPQTATIEEKTRMDDKFAGYKIANGIAGGYEITRWILRMAVRREEDVEWKYQRMKRKQFCSLRSVCRIWKEIVDSFVDLFDYGDLVEAIRRRSPYSVRLLLPLTDFRQHNPLCDAFELNVVSKPEGADLVRALLADPRVDPTGQHNRAMREASSAGLSEVVGILLEDVRVDPAESLMRVVREGRTEMVRLMLAHPRVDPSVENNKAIRVASRRRSADIVRLLLNDARVDPSANKNYAIIRAARNGKLDMVELLLAHSSARVDPSAMDNEAIRLASRGGHDRVVELLLKDPRVNPSSLDDVSPTKKRRLVYQQSTTERSS